MEYQRLALILDDEASQIGELALQLVRLGVNVLYANDFDETVLLARQAADDVGAVIVPSCQATGWLPMILKRLRLPPAAVVPAGKRPDDATLESLRCEGVRWALWLPDDDRAVRFVVTAAMSETDATEIRFDLRVPTELEGSVQRGPLDRPCEIRNLSRGGALVALEPLVPVGSRITLRLGVGDAPLSLCAKVAWSTECTEVHPPEPSPVMGVCFDDVDPEARGALLRFLGEQLERFHL
jgi:hypothetical protein